MKRFIFNRTAVLVAVGACLVAGPALAQSKDNGDGDEAKQKKQAKLPGIEIDKDKRFIDLDARVVLREEATLELVACSQNTKEHESVFSLKARPMHIHLALMIIGCEPGHPGGWHVTKEKTTRIDPKGDRIRVSVVMKNKDGEIIERPASDFVWDPARKVNLPHSEFVFAGSKMTETESGREIYEADVSGNVISIATFSDDLLSWPKLTSHQQADGELIYEPKVKAIPPVNTAVKIRLTPVPKPKKEDQNEAGAAESDDKAGESG